MLDYVTAKPLYPNAKITQEGSVGMRLKHIGYKIKVREGCMEGKEKKS